MSGRMISRYAAPLVGAVAAIAVACPGGGRGDGLDASSLPESVRADYDLFAERCSKCHSLARPLDSGIDEDAWWSLYVARMRRMPGSGISEGDATAILRFLRYYSTTIRARKGAVHDVGAAPEPSAR